MKRKRIIAVLAICSAFMIVGCGAEDISEGQIIDEKTYAQLMDNHNRQIEADIEDKRVDVLVDDIFLEFIANDLDDVSMEIDEMEWTLRKERISELNVHRAYLGDEEGICTVIMSIKYQFAKGSLKLDITAKYENGADLVRTELNVEDYVLDTECGITDYYVDEMDWLGESYIPAMRYFYIMTGIRPFVYIADENHKPQYRSKFEQMENEYSELINDNNTVFICFLNEEYDRYVLVYNGNENRILNDAMKQSLISDYSKMDSRFGSNNKESTINELFYGLTYELVDKSLEGEK